MRKIIITSEKGGAINFKREDVDVDTAMYMLAETLIAICKETGVQKSGLDKAMRNLWKER